MDLFINFGFDFDDGLLFVVFRYGIYSCLDVYEIFFFVLINVEEI